MNEQIHTKKYRACAHTHINSDHGKCYEARKPQQCDEGLPEEVILELRPDPSCSDAQSPHL